MNLQGMLLVGLASYAAYIALKYLLSSTTLLIGDMWAGMDADRFISQNSFCSNPDPRGCVGS